ncbi:MAG: amidase family protein, partial [Chloroflexota bacterium]
LQVLAGPDPRDPTCMKDEPPDYLGSLDSGVGGLRALWVSDCGDPEARDQRVLDVAAAGARRLTEAGLVLDESQRGFEIERWIDAFYTMMHAERFVFTGRDLYEDPGRRGLLTDYAREHFGNARSIGLAEYVHASRTRYELLDWLDRWWAGYDLVLTPTVAMVAPPTSGPVVRRPLVAYTFLINYCGYAAATVPCGLVDGMPVGLQVIARPNQESLVLRASQALARLQPWSEWRPPVAAAAESVHESRRA